MERIEVAASAEPAVSRRALARQVCEWLDWRSPNGAFKAMSCRSALKTLERRGRLRLPAPHFPPVGPPKRTAALDDGLAVAPVETSLAALGTVDLIRVGSRSSGPARVWRSLLERYHPLGSGPLCGAQMRYLIRSSRHGWLGALAFSAAAWRLEPRDQWIGWSDAARQAHLSKVVANSRFLIRPEVRVPHLASHVLARCLRQLPRDWAERYGYAPLLVETFVEQARFAGTSYRAANWHALGATRGRGRQDRSHTAALPVKDIYVYPLRRDWRARLCAGAQMAPPAAPRRPAAEDWAEEEFGQADLGDARLSKRLRALARDFFAQPQANIPQACESRAKTKAAYRFFDHPDVTMDVVLAPHRDATRARIRAHAVVLAVQDTTTLTYTAHPATEGLGPINATWNSAVGLMLHDTMAFTVDGTPLGLLDVQCWARDAAQAGKKARRHQLPIAEKESRKWLDSYRAVARTQQSCPATMLVNVGDREADLYELFAEAGQHPTGPKLLVRAERTRQRRVAQGALWEHLAEQPVAGCQDIQIPRTASRPARRARLAVRFAAVDLQPPRRHAQGPVAVWAVYAHEVGSDLHSPAEPLSWMLLTTVETTSFEQACERLRWYTHRWGIEVYHRTLKSGCRIENRQLATTKRLEACLAIDLVVAWRVHHLAKRARQAPGAPCTVYFEEAEWKALTTYVTRNPTPPVRPPTLREAMRMVASLGGFLGRKGDGEPGTQTLWLGIQRLEDLTAMWCLLTGVPQGRTSTVSSQHDYG